jgi:Uma2 family endonuclease
MSVMTSVIPHGRPFTVDDLEGFPDDGNRYELIDGMLLVSPGPSWEHQEVGLSLFAQLRASCPPDLRALAAPFAVQTALDTEVQPDVLVARYVDFRSTNLPVAPLLAVEVLSRGTRLKDRNLKKAHYERIGVTSYWIVDPAEPGALTAFELDGAGRYTEIAHVTDHEEFAVVPARLLEGLYPRE